VIADVRHRPGHANKPYTVRFWVDGKQLVAVGTAIAGGPPRRSQRAGLPHWAPVMGIWRRTALGARGA
jgi:hypothetical protein